MAPGARLHVLERAFARRMQEGLRSGLDLHRHQTGAPQQAIEFVDEGRPPDSLVECGGQVALILGGHVEQQREVGLAVAVDPGLELADARGRHAVPSPLVGEGRVAEAIAHHPVAPRQCRTDHLREVLAARGEHQQRLAVVRHWLVEEQFAQRLAQRRAPGLARRHRAVSRGHDAVDHPGDVRALAGAVDAFDGDELRGFVRHLVEESW